MADQNRVPFKPKGRWDPGAGRQQGAVGRADHLSGADDGAGDAGDQVGTLRVWIGEALTLETPLFTAEAVAVGSLHRRAFDAVGELMVGSMR